MAKHVTSDDQCNRGFIINEDSCDSSCGVCGLELRLWWLWSGVDVVVIAGRPKLVAGPNPNQDPGRQRHKRAETALCSRCETLHCARFLHWLSCTGPGPP